MEKCSFANVNSIYHSLTVLTNQKEKEKRINNLKKVVEMAEENSLDNKYNKFKVEFATY